jgi:hypothetical protein
LVVRETVLAVVGVLEGAGTDVCVCAKARVATKTTRAKDRFFTGFSISGGDKN